ncbi:IclR family transcriptional regulator [Ketogulonicigenium vulgare]|uniref:Putative transcriptional regulator, IclR family protein n=1 Tax=Ketogulonicigenium vulgare (strain WSH-001) TaxID=759362 RepID=F9YB04_KETVW|nr:IclR family transcriptional regulator [Ketogulonicigenium vulgare]ADO44029.1 Transcriptional regulator [Ketogulonicigenium vulgare Y25]AEM42556.1 putative transcriptional regulator, IclR family protein [Ketogulonicigenium vulgare WSH-001]ALJ82588.1 IclR family transcriptional regulator [Ketogulonicigenium vulgare]ANW35348.1 IclR family transcriptional regulator [Ketogulonicigenium vulgare]AOZ53258.1 Transcriptional regulator [Ketogulonicigenium vulgare]
MPGNATAVIAVERAIALLDVFQEGDTTLSLAELARRTGLDKSTVLRISRTMATGGLMVQGSDSTWRLGPKLAHYGARYTASFIPEKHIAPELAILSAATGESAAIYIREGDKRVCLLRHDSTQAIRHSARIGDAMPINKGAAGWVMMAFDGEAGEPCATIRARGYHVTRGERDPEVASLAVPVWTIGGKLFGSVVLTGPLSRFDDEKINEFLPHLLEGARRISAILGAPTG